MNLGRDSKKHQKDGCGGTMWDLRKQFNPHIPCQSRGNLTFFVLKVVCGLFLVGPLDASASAFY